MIDVALEFVEKKKDKKMGEEQYLDYVDTFCKPTSSFSFSFLLFSFKK